MKFKIVPDYYDFTLALNNKQVFYHNNHFQCFILFHICISLDKSLFQIPVYKK